ncbi:MAG: PEP/pyruvate-binding domain-containing protein, partial [Desulfovibrionaceae bacterium]
MQSILNAISRVIRRPASEKDESSRQFLARCENFRLLLAANNRALEIMAEMSELERAGRVPAIAQVRAMTFKVVASVRQMIERLCRMRPGRYDALKESFDRIVGELERALSDQRPRVRGPLVLPLAELTAAHTPETGSKAALLGEAGARLGLRVPRGFSITASAYRLFMEETGLQDEINRLTQIGGGEDYAALSALEAAIGSAVASWPLPAPLEAEIKAAVEALAASGVGPGLAVRSSALDEDSPGASFAGQFLSVLGVEPGGVVEAWRRVVASMFSAQAMTYRLRRGLRDDGLAMAVGCMEMIDAASGGVAYTRDPLGRRPELVVSAVRGLPDAIVDGSGRADTWLVDRETLAVVEARIEEKRWQNALTPEGRVERRNIVDAAPRDPALGEEQVREVARAALALEAHFGGPQDVEWAFARADGPGNDGEGGLVLLQCRPLHVAGAGDAPAADPGAPILSGAGTACLGRASGPVFLVEGEDDLASFPEGAVLLARNAQPRLAALLPRAAALVAENGSVTGHLANVAREYGVPALVGASGAVELLAGAGVVTVDADTGAVHAGDVAGLTASPRRPEHGPATAVGAALGRVLPFIAPLHLTDPQAENFSPGGCATLHDITRYCHEKAVIEMFREGGSSGGRLGGARQLVGKGALEYWVVDIGGGTAPPDPDSNERYIPV